MLVTTTQSLCLLFKQQREKSSMPEDRTWCSRGNLGRFEEHSVTRCCVWGESCGGNPQLEQNKTEDARNKIFWGWIVISCCKMCLLLCKNEGFFLYFCHFLNPAYFFAWCTFHFITTHFAIKVNICVQENHIHIYFSTSWVKSFVFNILLLETTPWTHNIRLFIFALCLPAFLPLSVVWSHGEKGNQGSFPPVWKKTTQTLTIMSSFSVWYPDNPWKLPLLSNTYNRYTDTDEDSHMTGVYVLSSTIFFLSSVEVGTQSSPFYLFSQGQNMMGGWPDARQR